MPNPTRSSLARRLRSQLGRLGPAPVGYVDSHEGDRLSGWATDPAAPSEPARLKLMVDGRHEMNLLADIPRDDVARTGRAPLRCGFDVALPPRLRGGAHRLELRLASSGRLLRGGRIRTGGSGIAHLEGGDGPEVEGLAWIDTHRREVTGWVRGAAEIEVAIDDIPARTVTLDREVPGFGPNEQCGFAVPIPPAGPEGDRVRTVRVTARGHEVQGSPLTFDPRGARALQVAADTLPGGRLRLRLHDRQGAPVSAAVTVLVDGRPVATEAGERTGESMAALSPDARHVVVVEGAQDEAGRAPGTVLGRYVVSPGQTIEDWSADVPDLRLDAPELPEELCARARAAFDAFCTDPDARFDPEWYAAGAGVAAGDALAHWRETGAAAGLPPGPGFDEAAARALHPAVDRAVSEGRLPCAFALELAIGRSALGSLTGLVRPLRRPPQPAVETPAPPPPELPPRPVAQASTDGIYAAWLARLDMAPALRGDVDADETAMRREIARLPLPDAPLVSIIMPSWNRAFTIGEAIQSVMEQSYSNWELLVCDDASEDRTADVVRGFDDPRIRYMRFAKSNGAGARNNGLRFARGDYVAYLDSDNMWHPLFLDRMLRELAARPGTAIVYGAYLDTEIQGARVVLHEISRPFFRPVRLSSKNFMDLNSIVHHRRVTDWMGGFDESLPRLQDWDLMLRYTGVFPPRYVDRIGVFYRRSIAWGQVTMTQMGSGAQNTVNAKTRARLAGAHETPRIDWPAPPRTTVLAGPRDGATRVRADDLALARGLVELAAASGPARLVLLARPEPGAPPLPEDATVLPEGLLEAPGRLGLALGGVVAEGAILAVGPGPGRLRTIPELVPQRTVLPVSGAGGTVLGALDRQGPDFPLGTIPLPGAPAGAVGGASGRCLLAVGVRPGARGPLAHAAAEAGFDLRVSDADRAGLIAQLPEMAAVLSAVPVQALDPFDFALLQAAQAARIPTAVPPAPDDDPGAAPGAEMRAAEDLGRQWIEARASYPLHRTTPHWIFEKLNKLMNDRAALERFGERGEMVHAIAFHPALLRARMAHALRWIQADIATDPLGTDGPGS